MEKDYGEIFTSASYNIKVKNKCKAQELSEKKGYKSVSAFINKLIEDTE